VQTHSIMAAEAAIPWHWKHTILSSQEFSHAQAVLVIIAHNTPFGDLVAARTTLHRWFFRCAPTRHVVTEAVRRTMTTGKVDGRNAQ